VVDVDAAVIENLVQPGGCTMRSSSIAPFLVVTSTDPFALGFVSPIACFRNQLVASVHDLLVLRADLEQELLGTFSPLLGAYYAIQCGGESPPAGCDALQTRLQTGLPSVADVNTAMADYDAALAALTP
jgi:hypothetical protein